MFTVLHPGGNSAFLELLMDSYAQFLVPLIRGIHPTETAAGIKSPLEEEMWLLGRTGICIDWQALARQSRVAYGLDLLYEDSEIPPCSYSLSEHIPNEEFRYIASDDAAGYFVMEHPSQLSVFDRTGKPDQQPVLARPSVFAKWASLSRKGPGDDRHSAQNGFPDVPEDSIVAFRNLMKELTESKPTDWHLEPSRHNYRSRIRVNGSLTEPVTQTLQKGQWITNSLKAVCGIEQGGTIKAHDGAFTVQDGCSNTVSVRVSMIPSLYGEAITARFFYPGQEDLTRLEKLGLEPFQVRRIEDAYLEKEGLWIVAGPTGSGKSTTLHALLQVSVQRNNKVVTIEDPVEKTIRGAQQVSIDPHFDISYHSALKAFMRQAPDTILIGEIRDQKTAEIAIQASFSGHRILTTLHAGDNAGVIRRFQDFKIDRHLIISAVTLAVHQRLIPVLCQYCKKAVKLPEDTQTLICRETGIAVSHTQAASGCNRCRSGYACRTGVFHIARLCEDSSGNSDFPKIVLKLLESGKIDLHSAISFFPEAIRHHLYHQNCKDFANYCNNRTR